VLPSSTCVDKSCLFGWGQKTGFGFSCSDLLFSFRLLLAFIWLEIFTTSASRIEPLLPRSVDLATSQRQLQVMPGCKRLHTHVHLPTDFFYSLSSVLILRVAGFLFHISLFTCFLDRLAGLCLGGLPMRRGSQIEGFVADIDCVQSTNGKHLNFNPGVIALWSSENVMHGLHHP